MEKRLEQFIESITDDFSDENIQKQFSLLSTEEVCKLRDIFFLASVKTKDCGVA